MQNIIHYISQHSSELLQHLFEHIYLSLSAILIAFCIAIPLGIFSYQNKISQRIILPLNNVFQTIPSLALLAFLIPFIGIGVKPTIITLVVYSLLPITRNTYIGLTQIPNEMIEAANGLGFTRWQRLKLIEVPLAMPVIFSGIRVATAMSIGITTIAAFIGAGGLGTFITQGLALNQSGLILLGAIPTALLALAADFILAQFETLTVKPKRNQKFNKTRWLFVFITLALLIWLCVNQITKLQQTKKYSISIATKNFTESFILGYLMADIIQEKTNLNVKMKMNLGSTTILQNAITTGEIDLYPEYTGTAYFDVLHQTKVLNPEETFTYVKSAYKKRFNLIWLKPFGFSNSQTLAVRANFAKRYHLKTLSDLKPIAPQLIVAAPAEFIKRADALPTLEKIYHLHFKKVVAMQPDLVFKAIKNKDADVVMVFMTDPRIQSDKLVTLKDDKHIFPPYDAAPLIRQTTLDKHPEVKAALNLLAGKINNETMQRLNAKVETRHQSPQKVAHNYLVKLGFKE